MAKKNAGRKEDKKKVNVAKIAKRLSRAELFIPPASIHRPDKYRKKHKNLEVDYDD